MLAAVVGMLILADGAVSSGPALVIPIALVVVGLGIIGTMLRLTWVVSSSATKIMLDVEQLTSAMKGLQSALANERDERMQALKNLREEQQAFAVERKQELADLQGAVDDLRSEVHGLELRIERRRGD